MHWTVREEEEDMSEERRWGRGEGVSKEEEGGVKE